MSGTSANSETTRLIHGPHEGHMPVADGQGRRVLVSVVIPCFNEQESLPHASAELSQLARRFHLEEQCDTEFIMVDDGSSDNTWQLIKDWGASEPAVVGIRFSRNFGHQAALACGYRHSHGDVVACLDADIQDPPEVLIDMLRAWRDGADVIVGVRRTRSGETWFKLATASAFYWFINKVGAKHVRPNVGDFRLLSRRALDSLLQLIDSRPFYREMVAWIGFPAAEVHYDRRPRASGTTKYTFSKMVRLAVDAIVGSTTRPLLFSWFAVLVVLLLALGLPVALWLLGPLAAPSGAVICFCAALILIGQGVQGLYLSRLFDNARGRPLYLISDVIGLNTELNRIEVRDLPAAEIPQASRSRPAPDSPLSTTSR